MMRSRRLIWQIYPSFLAISLCALVVIAIFSMSSIKTAIEDQTRSELTNSARLIARSIQAEYDLGNEPAIERFCKETSRVTHHRITAILPSGVVIGDSDHDPKGMERHNDRPEIISALKGNEFMSIRHSHTLDVDMMYVAVPMMKNGRTVGVLRTAAPMPALAEALRPLYLKLIMGAFVIALLVAIASYFLSRKITRPLEEIRHGAREFTKGNLRYKLTAGGSAEVEELSEAMNLMAVELFDRISRLSKLEALRREFVANVSHELKTPITSIKGFAETLRDGAIDDPQKARPFLNIISAHVERLEAIIEDLLDLSRIEQEADTKEIRLEEGPVGPVIESAVQLCRTKSAEKNIELKTSCAEDLKADFNQQLLEQAISNLIDNAIKYSEDGSEINISAERTGNNVAISVTDHGCGIPTEHQQRIFERFYRVDKGRSRKLGGTGLGLAIVKHIVQVHGGEIFLESEPEKGSKFTIVLKCANRP